MAARSISAHDNASNKSDHRNAKKCKLQRTGAPKSGPYFHFNFKKSSKETKRKFSYRGTKTGRAPTSGTPKSHTTAII